MIKLGTWLILNISLLNQLKMARIETHCEDCIRLLGNPYIEVHKWLDFYAKQYNPHVYLEYHRRFRHTKEALDAQFANWSEEQQIAAKIHIVRDYEMFILRKLFTEVKLDEIDELFEKAEDLLHSF